MSTARRRGCFAARRSGLPRPASRSSCVVVLAALLAATNDDGAAATAPAQHAAGTHATAVPIATAAAMTHPNGTTIRDCIMPHIHRFPFGPGGTDMWLAVGFGIPANATGDERYATCYASPDLRAWVRQEPCAVPGMDILHNARTGEYVAFQRSYGRDEITAATSRGSPLGPYTPRPAPMAPLFGGIGDFATFVDDDGTAFVVYNRYTGPIPQRFTYVYQLDENYTDVVPDSLANVSHVMEGLWMLRHGSTYFLLGSPLVVYDDADDFYLTAPHPLGPWTYGGLLAPAGTRTFDSQVFRGLVVPPSSLAVAAVAAAPASPPGNARPGGGSGGAAADDVVEEGGGSSGAAVVISTRWCNPYPAHTPPSPAVCPPTCVCKPPFRNATSLWLPLRFTADGRHLEPLQWVDEWELDV